jgi:hypothetical protein
METWVWLGAYVVGFVLLQVYLYQYFIRRRSSSESGGTTTSLGGGTLDTDSEQETSGGVRHSDVDHTPDLGPPQNLDDGDAVRCDECGAYNENDQMFAYCRNCGETL